MYCRATSWAGVTQILKTGLRAMDRNGIQMAPLHITKRQAAYLRPSDNRETHILAIDGAAAAQAGIQFDQIVNEVATSNGLEGTIPRCNLISPWTNARMCRQCLGITAASSGHPVETPMAEAPLHGAPVLAARDHEGDAIQVRLPPLSTESSARVAGTRPSDRAKTRCAIRSEVTPPRGDFASQHKPSAPVVLYRPTDAQCQSRASPPQSQLSLPENERHPSWDDNRTRTLDEPTTDATKYTPMRRSSVRPIPPRAGQIKTPARRGAPGRFIPTCGENSCHPFTHLPNQKTSDVGQPIAPVHTYDYPQTDTVPTY